MPRARRDQAKENVGTLKEDAAFTPPEGETEATEAVTTLGEARVPSETGAEGAGQVVAAPAPTRPNGRTKEKEKELRCSSDYVNTTLAGQEENRQLNELLAKQAQLASLEHEKSEVLKQFGTSQEKTRTMDLETTPLERDMLKLETKKGEVVVESLRNKLDAAENQRSKTNRKEHIRAASASNSKIRNLQEDLAVAKENNVTPGREVEDASDDRKTNQTQIVGAAATLLVMRYPALPGVVDEATKVQEKNKADLNSFQLQEAVPQGGIKKGEVVENLLGESDAAEEKTMKTSEKQEDTATLSDNITDPQDDFDDDDNNCHCFWCPAPLLASVSSGRLHCQRSS